MKSVSSRIWTRIAVSISYDDNHFTTGTSLTINDEGLKYMNFDDNIGDSTQEKKKRPMKV